MNYCYAAAFNTIYIFIEESGWVQEQGTVEMNDDKGQKSFIETVKD